MPIDINSLPLSLHSLLAFFAPYRKKRIPDQKLFWRYLLIQSRKAHAKLRGDAKLQHEPVVASQFSL
jgi:hypothetical protein